MKKRILSMVLLLCLGIGQPYMFDFQAGEQNVDKVRAESSEEQGTNILSIPGGTGENFTGVTVGGMEIAGGEILTVGRSLWKPEDTEPDEEDVTQPNLFLAVTSKNLEENNIVWLTSYKVNSRISIGNPYIIRGSEGNFWVLWEESVGEYKNDQDNVSTMLVQINAQGQQISEKIRLNARLSDCEPIVNQEGNLVWYETNSSTPIFYEINPAYLKRYDVGEGIAIDKCNITGVKETYFGEENVTPVVTYGNYVLKEKEDYTCSFPQKIDKKGINRIERVKRNIDCRSGYRLCGKRGV